jgi:hypothetical protein
MLNVEHVADGITVTVCGNCWRRWCRRWCSLTPVVHVASLSYFDALVLLTCASPLAARAVVCVVVQQVVPPVVHV